MAARFCTGRFVGLLAMAAAVAFATELSAAGPDEWRQQGWSKTDFAKRTIEWKEIISGGPPKDGIPAIDRPKFVSVDEEREIADQEPVITLAIGGEARAYPIRILMWHEIVNDSVGGVAVAVTYCPLCNSAVVFESKTSRGVTTFGTTGKLRNSDLVMYDRGTQTWWQQFTGRAIVGALAGEKLSIIPTRIESFASFKQRFPNGRVLVPNDPSLRQYGRNPYEGYDTSSIPFLYRGEFRDGIEPMVRVVVVREGERVFGVTLELLRKAGAVQNGEILISWRAGQASALDHPTISGGRDVGNVVARKDVGEGRFEDVAYDVTFAFAFHAFHPEDHLLTRCPEASDSIRCGSKAGG